MSPNLNDKIMEHSLSSFLNQIEDKRREQGKRHQLSTLFIISLMAILSKQQSLKGITRFAKSNADELTKALSLKHGVPKFNTFRDFFQQVNTQLLVEHFIAWMQAKQTQNSPDELKLGAEETKSSDKEVKSGAILPEDAFIAFDGKAVKATVAGGNTNLQNFISVVSAYGHQSGLVYGMESYENGKSAETQSLWDLMEKLGLVDKIITMDAVHTKKNF